MRCPCAPFVARHARASTPRHLFPLQVELFAFTTPEQSNAQLDEIVALQEELFTDLGLHYQYACTNEHGGLGNAGRADGTACA